jgi:ubiquinone biosynthesis protein UbiJ
MNEQAFEALKTYDWGMDPKVLQPLEDAIVKSHGDAAARKELETRLAEVLKSAAPRAAKDAVCRMLKTIGTATSVPALAALLPDDKLSHMARFALESIAAPEAGQALLAALPKVAGKLKIGVISSLGVRGDAAGIAPLQALLADSDTAVARAAAQALGAIATPQAGGALAKATPSAATKVAMGDASLRCAEKLLAGGRKAEAKATYQRLLASQPPKPLEQAATRGLQACDAN